MILIADILERKGDQVLTVTADTPVARVAERMALARVGAFVVSRDGVHVDDAAPIATSFPDFVALMTGLGAPIA